MTPTERYSVGVISPRMGRSMAELHRQCRRRYGFDVASVKRRSSADDAGSGRPGELGVGLVVATLWVGARVCGFTYDALLAAGLS